MAKKNRKTYGAFQSDALENPSKTLLANIRFASIDNPIKTIVVTSSIMDEGKSTVSSNLACAIASSGKRVLIVDADLRRRSLGAMLGVHNANGIFSVLSGQAALRSAITATQIPNLFFMDCEPNVPNPADIFSTKRFAVFMDKIAQLFDYIILDTPPIGLFVDAAVASNLADGTVLVVRQGGTKRAMVEKSIQQLHAADANILGLVMTFVDAKKSDGYYYSYYNEDGKRSKKKHKGEDDSLVEGSSAAIAAIAGDNIDDWMVDAGIGPIGGQRQAQTTAAKRAAINAPEIDPFAPGAFRAGGDGAGNRSTRTRARRGLSD